MVGGPDPRSRPLQYVERFKDPLPMPVKNQTPKEIRERRKLKASERHAKRLAIHVSKCAFRAARRGRAPGAVPAHDRLQGTRRSQTSRT